MMHEDAPSSPFPANDEYDRRRFLRLMAASLAMAGVGGCSVQPAPPEQIIPYVHQPGEVTPGKPSFYATSMTFGGSSVGLLVESRTGRPIKIEGNPNHPASLGATDPFHQASILTLYDPERAKTVTRLGMTRTWDEALSEITRAIRDQQGAAGSARLLSETIVSPTLGVQIQAFLKAVPGTKWHVYEPIHRDLARRAQQLAFGRAVDIVYNFSKADVVLSLESDFLQCGLGNLRYASDFMNRRRVRTGLRDTASARMNRLYVIETGVSATGVKADHRLAVRAREVERLARSIAARLGVVKESQQDLHYDKWVSAAAKDLQMHQGRSLVVAGERQSKEVHLLAYALNESLGNVGRTLHYIDPVDLQPAERTGSLVELVADMKQGCVSVLIMLGGNPAYTAPADLNFAEYLQKVPLSVHHSLALNETSYRSHWHLPESHYLEAWGDGRAYDGTASLVQPLIEPLYSSRSAIEVVAAIGQALSTPGRELVRDYWRQYWQEHRRGESFRQFWERSLHDGVIAGTASKPSEVKLKDGWQRHLSKSLSEQHEDRASELDLVFQPDPTVWDGSWATNAWLQELPKPLTKICWGNAAMMSPDTARRLGIAAGAYAHGGERGGYHMPLVELAVNGRTVHAPTWILPGLADQTVVVYLGNGRESPLAKGEWPWAVGFNAYPLRTTDRPWVAAGLRVSQLDGSEVIACTQCLYSMKDREPVKSYTLSQYRQKDLPAHHSEMERALEESLYEPFQYPPPQHKWGMIIDVSTCVGCHACVVACQAENNIPVVGKREVAFGRSMHWLRIDRYLSESADQYGACYHFQPVPCMHCEHAPCEYVCPVAATVHSADGLNDMIYNRCVGTRFCSNNCPYKVRRFNFFAYADFDTPVRRLQYNPEVTVRSRGVMEKCTYCVQRIRRAEVDSQIRRRPLRDAEILTACQAACPVDAIVFGDLNNQHSKVARWKQQPHHYGLLAELNTQPRTTYLAELRNPNPELPG